MERYSANPYWKEFFQSNEEIEASELINNQKVPIRMIHFLYRYFPLNKKEIESYKKRCKISDSKYFFNSEDISNSMNISESKEVENSEYIYFSKEIIRSFDVYNSRDIKNSQDIKDSFEINNSYNIIDSKQIKKSSNVYRSTLIEWSKNIINSSFVDECEYIYQSSHVKDCYFGGFLTNCRHCLFCTGLSDKEYYIFNKPTDPIIFERYKEELQYRLENEVSNFIKIDRASHNIKNRYEVSMRYDSIFEGLSDDLYGWIGSIEGCTDELFLQIFLTNNLNLN